MTRFSKMEIVGVRWLVMEPKAGEHYSVVDGDRLWNIAAQVYGSPYKYSLIVSANPQLSGRPKVEDGSPVIYGGDTIMIPGIATEESPESVSTVLFADQQRDQFSVEINGERIPVVSGSFFESMDHGSDELTFSVDKDSLSSTARNALKPFKYPECKLYVYGILELTGAVYIVEPSISSDGGRVATYTAYSKTIDVVDSAVNVPLEINNSKLLNIAKKRLADLSISAVFMSGADEYFDKVKAKSGEKRFSELSNLARQRGILLSSTAEGNLLFHRANLDEVSVATIAENESGSTKIAGKFDGRERFSSYKIVGKSTLGKSVTKTVTDTFVSKSRFFVRNDSGSDAGTAIKAAKWERSKAVSDALTMAIPVDDWFDDNGSVWKSNRYVTVISETLDITKPTLLLIRRRRLNWSATSRSAVLDVVPKEVFTGEEVPDIWG